MSEIKHLERFEVENFKCFSKLVLEDIGQFNIFLGDNNVGKTTLLEALLFDEVNHTEHMRMLFDVLYERRFLGKDKVLFNELDVLSFFSNKQLAVEKNRLTYKVNFSNEKPKRLVFETANIEELTEEEKEKLNEKYNIKRTATKIYRTQYEGYVDIDFFSNAFLTNGKSYKPYIPVNMGYDKDLAKYYSQNIAITKEAKKDFAKSLEFMVKGVEDIDVSVGLIDSHTFITLWVNGIETPLPLPAFGEGSVKLFRILAELIISQNQRLMIDEIDTGIHYSKFKQYWKTILKSANNNNVQLFSTTHSLECLKYFTQALEEDEMQAFRKKARIYTLFKNREGNIEAIPHRFEQFEHAINNEIELRK